MKKKRFPSDVARFFNPHKSNPSYPYSTHQLQKAAWTRPIPVYSEGGTARKVQDTYGRVSYKIIDPFKI